MWHIAGNDHGTEYAGNLNDVWYSENCSNWVQANVSVPWRPRHEPQCLVFKNKIWVMGGNPGSGWDLEDDVRTYTAPGLANLTTLDDFEDYVPDDDIRGKNGWYGNAQGQSRDTEASLDPNKIINEDGSCIIGGDGNQTKKDFASLGHTFYDGQRVRLSFRPQSAQTEHRVSIRGYNGVTDTRFTTRLYMQTGAADSTIDVLTGTDPNNPARWAAAGLGGFDYQHGGIGTEVYRYEMERFQQSASDVVLHARYG